MDKEINSSFRKYKHSSHKSTLFFVCSCILILCVTLAYISIEGLHKAHADTGNSFTQGVNDSGSGQALFWFQPTGWTAGYVIIHYTVNGANQQNLNMAYNNGTSRWEYTASGLSSGQVISYSFTYQVAGLQYDTGNYTWTVGSGSSGGTPTPTPTSISGSTPTPVPTSGTTGTFPLILQNNTNGAWANNQVYVTILGQATPGQWSYVHLDGTETDLKDA